jgi:hypothetical protein
MDDAWEILKDAGLPDGAVRSRPRGPLDGERLRAAVTELAKHPEKLPSRRLEPLLAWLQGGYHHWPRRFGEILGPVGASYRDYLVTAAEGVVDPNRYLKLRRIAIENLSAVLR